MLEPPPLMGAAGVPSSQQGLFVGGPPQQQGTPQGATIPGLAGAGAGKAADAGGAAEAGAVLWNMRVLFWSILPLGWFDVQRFDPPGVRRIPERRGLTCAALTYSGWFFSIKRTGK